MLSETIQLLCKCDRISVHALEQELRLANGSIARWSRSDPAVSKVKAVADRFGITVDCLLKGEVSKDV